MGLGGVNAERFAETHIGWNGVHVFDRGKVQAHLVQCQGNDMVVLFYRHDAEAGRISAGALTR